jgi:hypothetical protein
MNVQPAQVMLFGDFQWNQRTSTMGNDPNSVDWLTFEERQKLGMSPDSDNYGSLPVGIERVKDWSAVVVLAQYL